MITCKQIIHNPDELQTRIEMSKNRILCGTCPSYDESFILADIALNPKDPRRFDEYSGDISGRYLSVLAQLPKSEWPETFQALVLKILTYQHPDGRFGNPQLSFSAECIDKMQMALLWGNGRLLLGLLDYYNVVNNPAVLASSRRLAEFLVSVINAFDSPQMQQKLATFDASGFICLTQYNESLIKLYQITACDTFLEAAKTITAWTQPRGEQHTHGYLTTLRGSLSLYEVTGDAQWLEFAKSRYDSILESDDYKVFGGVAEFFGNNPPHGPNDEGCSEADFTKIGFQLWDATGDVKYLEKAEYCLMNQFFANQFYTGDFGHHAYDGISGFKLSNQEQKAWWCCSLHGKMFLNDVQNQIVKRENGTRKINLFFAKVYLDDEIGFSFAKIPSDEVLVSKYTVVVTSGSQKRSTIAIRNPSWSERTDFKINGEEIKPKEDGAYFEMDRIWNIGDKIEVSLSLRLTVQTPDGKSYRVDELEKSTAAYLIAGPYLLAADGNCASDFLSEPCDANYIFIGSHKKCSRKGESFKPETYLNFSYKHTGFPGIWETTLRPISETSFDKPTYYKCLLTFNKNRG